MPRQVRDSNLETRAARGKSQASAGTGTVAAAMEDYFKFLETEGRSERSIQDARGRSNALIIPQLGNAKVASLSADRLTNRRNEIASAPPPVRTVRRYQSGSGYAVTNLRTADGALVVAAAGAAGNGNTGPIYRGKRA